MEGASWANMTIEGFEELEIFNFRGRNGEIFASTYLGILRSTESGATWSLYRNKWLQSMVSIRGRNAVLSGNINSLNRTIDDGLNWETVTAGLSVRRIHTIATSPTGSIFAADFDMLFRSTDRGERWDSLGFAVPLQSFPNILRGEADPFGGGAVDELHGCYGTDIPICLSPARVAGGVNPAVSYPLQRLWPFFQWR